MSFYLQRESVNFISSDVIKALYFQRSQKICPEKAILTFVCFLPFHSGGWIFMNDLTDKFILTAFLLSRLTCAKQFYYHFLRTGTIFFIQNLAVKRRCRIFHKSQSVWLNQLCSELRLLWKVPWTLLPIVNEISRISKTWFDLKLESLWDESYVKVEDEKKVGKRKCRQYVALLHRITLLPQSVSRRP